MATRERRLLCRSRDSWHPLPLGPVYSVPQLPGHRRAPAWLFPEDTVVGRLAGTFMMGHAKLLFLVPGDWHV